MKKYVDFIFELGNLKRIQHEGWKYLGDKFPESVADHSLRAAQIGFILACLENYKNPDEICSILVFHDMNECRIGDIHKIAKKYVIANDEEAVADQTKELGKIGAQILARWKNNAHQDSEAGIIAKDADLLEMAVTAKEYISRGYPEAYDWIDNISRCLKTKSAINFLQEIINSNPDNWWKNLKKELD